MKQIKDGWHKIKGYDVFIEDGIIKRGTSGENTNYKTVYPYRYSKKYQSWIIETGLTPAAFSAGVRRGTIQML